MSLWMNTPHQRAQTHTRTHTRTHCFVTCHTLRDDRRCSYRINQILMRKIRNGYALVATAFRLDKPVWHNLLSQLPLHQNSPSPLRHQSFVICMWIMPKLRFAFSEKIGMWKWWIHATFDAPIIFMLNATTCPKLVSLCFVAPVQSSKYAWTLRAKIMKSSFFLKW